MLSLKIYYSLSCLMFSIITCYFKSQRGALVVLQTFNICLICFNKLSWKAKLFYGFVNMTLLSTLNYLKSRELLTFNKEIVSIWVLTGNVNPWKGLDFNVMFLRFEKVSALQTWYISCFSNCFILSYVASARLTLSMCMLKRRWHILNAIMTHHLGFFIAR